MKVIDIANEIYTEMGSPTATSIPAISFWIRSKVGDINNLLFEDFVLNSAYEIVDGSGAEILPEAVAVIKKLYKVYDFEVQIRSNMSALSLDSILEVTDQGSSVKKVNRNEVSKTYALLKSEEQQNLKDLVTAYRMRGATPTQVVGDDTVRGFYGEVSQVELRIL